MHNENLIRRFQKDNINVEIYSDKSQMSLAAAEDLRIRIKNLLKEKDSINIAFAPAPSQYQFLETLLSFNDIEWNRVNGFHLDEFIGLDKDDPRNLGNVAKGKIFNRAAFKNVYLINGSSTDVIEECNRYSNLLKENVLDIACVGIGENGHIAFNEPYVSDFYDSSYLRSVIIDIQSKNQLCYSDKKFKSMDEVPYYVITLTIPAICSAKYIYAIAPGSNRSEAVKKTLEGKISSSCPSTALREFSNTSMYIDLDSASLLSKY